MPFHLTLKSRSPRPSSRFPLSITLAQSSPTVRDLKLGIESSQLNLSRHRQRITTIDKKQVLDDDEQKLEALGIKDRDELHIKDLGPQVGESLSLLFL
jgi:very-long-chain enoyl-CoA reductase